MKILHTSDWHLGKHLNSFERHGEQIEVLAEICDIADQENVHAVIIAGDLFDSFNPPTESTELFYKTLKKLANNGKRAVIAIAGNHDSPDRIEAPDPLARECGIILAGYPYSSIVPFKLETGLKVEKSEEGFLSIKIPDANEPLRIILAPYANEYRLKTYLGQEDTEQELRDILKLKWEKVAEEYCDTAGVNIMIAHLLFAKNGDEIPEEPEDEKPILHVGGAQVIYADDIPPQIQYTALGHLHRRQYVVQGGRPVIYSGSPLAYGFNESNQKKYVQILDVKPGGEPAISSVEITKGRKLLRKRAETIEEAISWLKENPDTLIELTMATENYLTAEERKRLVQAHTGLVNIIPEVKNQGNVGSHHQTIDLTKNMEELFKEYFFYEKNQKPDEKLLELFREVMAEGEVEASPRPSPKESE
jgi:DNA repair protein SbcD/Mre11